MRAGAPARRRHGCGPHRVNAIRCVRVRAYPRLVSRHASLPAGTDESKMELLSRTAKENAGQVRAGGRCWRGVCEARPGRVLLGVVVSPAAPCVEQETKAVAAQEGGSQHTLPHSCAARQRRTPVCRCRCTACWACTRTTSRRPATGASPTRTFCSTARRVAADCTRPPVSQSPRPLLPRPPRSLPTTSLSATRLEQLKDLALEPGCVAVMAGLAYRCGVRGGRRTCRGQFPAATQREQHGVLHMLSLCCLQGERRRGPAAAARAAGCPAERRLCAEVRMWAGVGLRRVRVVPVSRPTPGKWGSGTPRCGRGDTGAAQHAHPTRACACTRPPARALQRRARQVARLFARDEPARASLPCGLRRG
jgi:hypothetical protein